VVKFWQKRACNYANPFMRENTRGYRRKTVNLHVELVSDEVVTIEKASPNEEVEEECLTSKEWRILWKQTAVNVMVLPGMFLSDWTISDEVQGVTEAATSMLTTIAGNQVQLQDIQWETSHKNSIWHYQEAGRSLQDD
jgi:hypothetical protein